MTTPAPVQTYVLEPSPTGGGNMLLTHGGTGIRIYLPLGVCTIQLSWSGQSHVTMRYRPENDVTQEHIFRAIASSETDENRTGIVQLAVDKPGSALIFQNASSAESDMDKRLGVTIISMEMDLDLE